MGSKILSDLSGGRNGVDSPVSGAFPNNQCVEALNVDFRNGGIGRRRGGVYDVIPNTTGYTNTAPVYSLLRHVPGGDETLGQIWAFENAYPSTPSYIPGGSQTDWDVVASMTAISANAQQVNGVSFNGKLFLFYDGTTDRAKVYDPVTASIRQTGLRATTVAPVVTNTGVGAYAATLRYYRIRWVQSVGGVVLRASEPSPVTSFTPSGAGTGALITQPTPPSEDETHWDIEASADGVNFYELAFIPLATTTYTDSAAVSSYANGSLSKLLGTFTLIPSVKFGVTDGNRLIMGGAWENGFGSRIYWTPVLGSLNEGDDERIFQTATSKPYIDLDTKNGGDLTGLGQINGVIYAFKYHQTWRLTPTGDDLKPYQARRLSGLVGAVNHKSISLGEDTFGNPCLYFFSHNGPYRVGPNGIEYIGRDIEDLTRTSAGNSNINTVATIVVSHAVFYDDLSQWWVWFSTGTSNSPDTLCILDVKKATRRDEYGVRNGWSRFNGAIATAVCSCMGNYTLAATASLKPWIGLFHASNPLIGICDRADVQNDRGVTFQAYVKTKSLGDPESFGKFVRVAETQIVASHHTAAGVTLQQILDRDFGLELPTSTVLLEAADIDKRLVRQFDASMVADAYSVQVQLGDSAATSTAWQIDLWKGEVFQDGDGG